MNHADALATLAQRYVDWMDAIRRRDLEQIVSLYAEDGVYMAPGQPRWSGRVRIREAWRAHLQREGFEAVYEPDLVVSQSLDLAYDKGTYSVAFQRDGRKVEVRGKYVVVWKRDRGQWLIDVDIDNAD